MARISTEKERRKLQDILANLEVPITIICGENDPLIIQPDANTDIRVIPNSGHYPMIDNPDAIATIIDAVLAE